MELSTKLPPLAKAKYIQTFLPTSDHIRSQSVLTVETPDDLNNNKLGVSNIEEACQTCDNFMKQCNGHPAHLEIPIPIYRIFFVKRLVQILNCVCFYCQRLRLPKEDKRYDWIRSLPIKHRLNYMEMAAKTYKYCGELPKNSGEEEEEGDFQYIKSCDIHQACKKPFVSFQLEDKSYGAFVHATIRLDVKDYEASQNNPHWQPFSIGPQDILDCLNCLDEETKLMLGCNQYNEPSALMWDVLPIPSLNTRPSHNFSGIGVGKKRMFNDWTKFLRIIVLARNELRDIMAQTNEKITCCHYKFLDIEAWNWRHCFQYAYLEKDLKNKHKARLKKELSKPPSCGGLEASWRNLNKQVAAFHSHRHKKFMNKGSTYGKPLVNVEDRYKHQKVGRWRANVMARRVNYAGRGVLEGDLLLGLHQAGLPQEIICMNLSRKIYVTPYNIRDVQKWILNGPFQYPGANYVTMKTGIEINLAFYENRRDLNPNDILYVRRHILDGDMVMIGRQPTLHRPSMMSFEAKVIPEYVIRLHPAVFNPMGADCDGDEVNVHVPQTLTAIAEMKEISCVQNNIMKDGKIWIKFIQNAVVGAYLMSRPSTLLTQSQVTYIWPHADRKPIPPPSMMKPKRQWTGHQIISLLLPSDFTMNQGEVVIKNGQLLQGQLNDKVLNGHGGILHHMYRDYADRSITAKFIQEAYLLFQRYLDIFGHSAGYFDCAIDFHDQDAKEPSTFIQQLEKVKSFTEKMYVYADRFPQHTPDSHNQALENNIRAHIDKITGMSTNAVMQYHEHKDNGNGILYLIQSGAKGSSSTLNQMCGMVGQIYVMYRRFHATSSHYLQGRETLAAYGFVGRSYAQGLELPAVIAEAHATCESVVNKNKGTSKSGYTVRKLTNCMMGIVVDHYGRAIDTNNRVLWSTYGSDGYDPQCMTTTKLRLLAFKEWDILRRYGTMFNLIQMVAQSSLHTKSQWQKLLNNQPCSIDQTWFQQLQHIISDDGQTIADQTLALENVMQPHTLATWQALKRQPETIRELMSEVEDLLALKIQLQNLLARSHESFDISQVRAPFDFQHLFDRCLAVMPTLPKVDLTPLEYRQFTKQFWLRLVKEKLVVTSNLTLKSLFLDWLSTRSLMLRWKFGLNHIKWLAKEIVSLLSRAKIQAGESVGVNATQNMGEPFVQMSSSGDSTIVVKVNGEMKYTTVGELIDDYMERKQTYSLPGNSEILPFDDAPSVEILGITSKEKMEWSPVMEMSRHPPHGDLVKVTTRTGREVTCTLTHSFLKRSPEGGVESVKGSDLKEGDRIPVCKQIPSPNIEQKDYIQIGQYNIELDVTFGEFIGLFIAEGSTCVSNNTVSVSTIQAYYQNITREIFRKFRDSIQVLEKYHSVLNSKKRYRGCDIRIDCHVLSIWLRKHVGTYSNNKRIPDFVFGASKEFQAAVIRGMVDGDGNVEASSSKCIRYHSTSLKLLEQLNFLMTYFGIMGNIHNHKPANDDKSKGQVRQRIDELSIYGARYVHNYLHQIGSNNTTKQQALLKIADPDGKFRDHIDNIPFVAHLVSKIGFGLHLPGASRNYGRWVKKEAQGKYIGRNTLDRFIRVFEAHDNAEKFRAEINLLKQAVESDVIWDPIVKLEIIHPDPHEKVYDFSIGKTETFALASGIVVHNSLKTPHFSGKFLNVTGGPVRIAQLIDNNYTNPQMTVVLKKSIQSQTEAQLFGLSLVRCTLKNIMAAYPTFEFRDDTCFISIPINPAKVIKRMISLRAVVKAICQLTSMTLDMFSVPFMDSDQPWFIKITVPLESQFWEDTVTGIGLKKVDPKVVADNIIYNLCYSLNIHGNDAINNFIVDQITINTPTGKAKRWSISTLGSDLTHVLRLPQVDTRRTVSNDVSEMCQVLGMHAARKALENEFLFIMSGMADARHIKLIARMMASDLVIKGMKIKQVAQNIPPLQRAGYERGPEQMMEYCSMAEIDDGKTICGAALTNKLMAVGTGYNLKMIPMKEVKVPSVARIKYESKICQYVFSPKADGIRYFLVFFHNEHGEPLAALVDREFQVYMLPTDEIPENFFHGTVLDGELTEMKDGHRVFLIFDCLMSSGNKSAVLRYDQRLEIAREIVYRMFTDNLNRTCDTDYITRYDMGLDLPFALPISLPRREWTSRGSMPIGKLSFQLMVKPVFDLDGIVEYNKLDLPFHMDGYVLTNLYEPAYPFRIKKESIYKWKPRCSTYSENTIDFIVTPGTSEGTMKPLNRRFSNRSWKHELSMPQVEAFRTTQGDCQLWCPLPDKSQLCFSLGFTQLPLSESQVCECRWNYQHRVWEVVRFRKKAVNQWATVVATIQNIVEDIQLEELIMT